MSGSLPPDVSVVLATRGRPHMVGQALASLADQTLGPEHFEVVVVVNGPADGTREAVESVAARQPGLQVRVLESTRPGVAHARTVGLWAAHGTYMTILDDDDRVTPHYLEDLLAGAAPGIVPLAWLADVEPEAPDVPDFVNYYSSALDSLLERDVLAPDDTVPALRMRAAISLNVAKLIPVGLARTVGYDFSLRGGSDFVFWTKTFAHQPFRFRVLKDRRACYLRTKVPDSLSRRDPDYDFSITQRLACISSLESIQGAPDEAEVLAQHVVNAQLLHVRGHLERHPEQRSTVIADIEPRGLRRMRWDVVNGDAADELALHLPLDPTDRSAHAAGRAIRTRAVVADVLSVSASSGGLLRTQAQAVAAPYVGRCATLIDPASASPWPVVDAWTQQTVETIAAWDKDYRALHSLEAAPSHLVAAQLKLRDLSTRWVADLTDRTALDGTALADPGPAGSTVAALRAALDGRLAPDARAWDDPVALAAVAAAALADEVVVTDLAQRDWLVARVAGWTSDDALGERLAAVSTVRAHEALPAYLHQQRQLDVDLESSEVNLGLFRGGSALPMPLVDALSALPSAVRAQVRLHLFTDRPDEVARAAREAGVADCVTSHPEVSFLDFLALADRLDLVVVEGTSQPGRAPAGEGWSGLPSADLLAMDAPVWLVGALTEGEPGYPFRAVTGPDDDVAAVIVDLVSAATAGCRPR